MNILDAIILGLVQGATEFLPISSSGHLILFGRLLGAGELPLSFSLLMHLATLFAVILVMRKEVFSLIRRPLSKPGGLILIATAPTVVIALIMRLFFKNILNGEMLIFCFVLTAVIIAVSEFLETHNKKRGALLKPRIDFSDALVIGAVQGIAAAPGISRSGSTVCAAKMLGIDKKEAARFSFLISIPIIIGSFIVEAVSSGSSFSGAGGGALIAGFVSAFVSGLVCCKVMLKLFSNRSLKGFSVYLFLLSCFLVLDKFFLHIF